MSRNLKTNEEEGKMASTLKAEGTKDMKGSPPTNEPRDVLSLHEMFRIIGDQMTLNDMRSLKFLYNRIMPTNLRAKVNDGYTFLLALEKLGRVDETNFKYLLQVLRIITRHDLSQYVNLKRRRTVVPDPVDEYLQHTSKIMQRVSPFSSVKATLHGRKPSRPSETNLSEVDVGDHPAKRARLMHMNSTRVTRSQTREVEEQVENHCQTDSSTSTGVLGRRYDLEEIKQKVTCDIRLRVRAEYCDHESALEGNIFSNKPDLLERQFEKFMQANTILKSRDLGSIICDIKFSELTYLDAFWRDYINGSLLEALKGVFITESLKQAVGHEAIKLLVNVDEDDYEAGRIKLLKNLTE